jgi:hypothetical protein
MCVGGFGAPFAGDAEGLRGLPDEVFHLAGALFKVRVSVRL